MKMRTSARPLAAALALALAPATPALAMQFEFGNGIKANLDTTVTYGISIRASERDPNLIGIANGGTSRSVNEDDGNLNFDKGKAFANVIKATSDLEIKWRNFGFFGRGYAFYDFDLHDSWGPSAASAWAGTRSASTASSTARSIPPATPCACAWDAR
jgi:hypothetical protein